MLENQLFRKTIVQHLWFEHLDLKWLLLHVKCMLNITKYANIHNIHILWLRQYSVIGASEIGVLVFETVLLFVLPPWVNMVFNFSTCQRNILRRSGRLCIVQPTVGISSGNLVWADSQQDRWLTTNQLPIFKLTISFNFFGVPYPASPQNKWSLIAYSRL